MSLHSVFSLYTSLDGDFVGDTAQSSWTYSRGGNYYYEWLIFLVIITPALFANGITFCLIYFSTRRVTSSNLMVRYLALEDGILSLCCFISCTINMAFMEYAGSMGHCVWQSIYLCWGVLVTGYSLCLIAYNCDRKVRMKAPLTSRQVFLFHCFSWMWGLFVAVLCSVIISTPRLVPGSVFCVVSLLDLSAGLVFYSFGGFFIALFLIHRYLKIYLYIRNAADGLTVASQHRLAHERSIVAAKKMFIFVFCFLTCALPLIVASVYEGITSELASPFAHMMAGACLHMNSLINPCLYVFLNPAARIILIETINQRLPAWARCCGRCTTVLEIEETTTTGAGTAGTTPPNERHGNEGSFLKASTHAAQRYSITPLTTIPLVAPTAWSEKETPV